MVIMPSCLAQVTTTEFSFPDMDGAVLAFWTCEDCKISEIKSLLVNISEEWTVTRESILNQSINHFDPLSFVEDQDRRILSIYQYVRSSELFYARQEAYILLTEFKEVRECFTNDEYGFDLLLDAYSGYLSVHEIIHDEMMGLYEWSEFVWYVDKLKVKVERLELQLMKSLTDTQDEKVFLALERLKGCLVTLEDSLSDAYRPDFEMPCDELSDSFKELMRDYNQLINLL